MTEPCDNQRQGPQLHGWLVIDKPLGSGSTEAVSAVKRALRQGDYSRVKVGHGGTLDPLATGVLPIALGEATKLSGRMLDSAKEYAFTLVFGAETDTLDLEGAVIAVSAHLPSRPELERALGGFRGPIAQRPPAYSAIKIGGRRAYDLARAGEAPIMEARQVTIRELDIVDASGVDVLNAVTLRARVSKGTYIRALARDIALACGTVGHVSMLRRLQAGPFRLDQAISLDKLAELAKARELEQALLPLTAGLDDIPALPVTPDQARLLRQGQELVGIAAHPGLHLATDRSVPVALVELHDARLKVVRGFNL